MSTALGQLENSNSDDGQDTKRTTDPTDTISSPDTIAPANPQHQSLQELLAAKVNFLLYFLGHIVPMIFEPMWQKFLGVDHYNQFCILFTIGLYVACCIMNPWGYLPTVEKFDILVLALSINGTIALAGYKIYSTVEERRKRKRLTAEKAEQARKESEKEKKKTDTREEKFRLMDRGFLKRV